MSASKDHSYCVLPWAPCVWRGDGVHLKACRIFPDQGWSVCHLQWKHGVFNRWTAREGSVSLLLCVDPWAALCAFMWYAFMVCLLPSRICFMFLFRQQNKDGPLSTPANFMPRERYSTWFQSSHRH